MKALITIVSAALVLSGCKPAQETEPARVFRWCLADVRTAGTEDMAAAIKACSDAAQAIEAGTAKTAGLGP